MTPQHRHLTLDDFWALKQVLEVQLSPDGRTAAYVVGQRDEQGNKTRSAIWLVDTADGATRQFTSGESNDATPRFSPDGKTLAFVSRRHENKPQVFLMPVEGGEARRLTSREEGAHSPVWSPDGSRLCFTSEVETGAQTVECEKGWFEAHVDADQKLPRMRRQITLFTRFDGRAYLDKRPHLFVLDISSGEVRQLTDGDYDDQAAAWSPDGSLIAFASNRKEDAEHSRGADVYTVSVENGELRQLTDGSLQAQQPSWSPDGTLLAFYARQEIVPGGYQDTHIWLVRREGGEALDVSAQLDQSVVGNAMSDYMSTASSPPVWSPDGQTIYFTAVDHGDRPVYELSVHDGAIRRISPSRGVMGNIQVNPSGTSLIGIAAAPNRPFDLWSIQLEDGSERQLTRVNAHLLEQVALRDAERISFQGPEGWEIEGWLIAPDEAVERPYPLILQVHGGPHGAWATTFYFWAQVLAGAGYGTLYVNPRGSIGYGQRFAQAADWGQNDFGDLMAGVDAVIARVEADAERVGVTGGSYGGFMTNWIIGHTDRFAAAVSNNSISNFVSFYGVSDIGSTWFEHSFLEHFGGRFWESRAQWEKYIERSPISYVDNIHTPLLLISGEADYRCPIEQAEQLLTALRMLRRTVELVRLPGASHGVPLAPHQQLIRWQISKDWFDTYVKSGRQAPVEVAVPAD